MKENGKTDGYSFSAIMIQTKIESLDGETLSKSLALRE
jgi:hypothetical protein